MSALPQGSAYSVGHNIELSPASSEMSGLTWLKNNNF